MKIKAAVFDLDGTLVDSLTFWGYLWSLIGEKYLGNKDFVPTPEDDKTVRTLILSEGMELIHKNYNIAESGEDLTEFARVTADEFYATKVPLKKGVREFLEHLKSQGVKMCIASASAPAHIDIAVDTCKIREYFDAILSCATLGKSKDKPDIYLLAAETLGESVEDTWVFEDSLTAIETATKIGMPTVAIFDKFNFGQERMKEIATEYIAEGETLLKLI